MLQFLNKAGICGAPGSRAKAGGAVNHCPTQAPPANLTRGASALPCGWGGTRESCSSCPGGHSWGWKLHWPPCVLWSRAGPGAQAGREGAGQGRTRLWPAKEVAFPAECSWLPAARGGTAQSQPHLCWGRGWGDFPLLYIQLDFFLPCSLLGPGKVSQPLISLHHSLPSTTARASQCILVHAIPKSPQEHRGTRSCHRAGQAGLAAVSRGCSPAHSRRFLLGLTTAAFFIRAPEIPRALPWVPPLLTDPRVPFPGLLGTM